MVFAGGGTAGHVYPGLELAESLRMAGLAREDIAFSGTSAGSGADLVEDAGYKFIPIEIRGLSRKRIFANLGVLWLFFKATGRGVALLRRRRPRVVVGLGGYSSLPLLLAAALLGVPRTILQEDATLGVSNRTGSWLCRTIGVAFPAPALIFGRKGTRIKPAVRASIARLATERDPVGARVALDLDPDRKLVLFAGGSLGAGPVNDAAIASYDRWRDRGDLAVILLAGTRFVDECEARVEVLRRDGDAIDFRLIGFESRFDLLLEAADVAVTRGGATTIGELATSGTPAVVVPSSFVTANHQEPNARALENAGGCEVVLDSEIERVPIVVESLLAAPERREQMRTAGSMACDAKLTLADIVSRVGGLDE